MSFVALNSPPKEYAPPSEPILLIVYLNSSVILCLEASVSRGFLGRTSTCVGFLSIFKGTWRAGDLFASRLPKTLFIIYVVEDS